MRNYFNYFTEIEEHFSQLRGRHLLVSPLDWCLIELWKDSGVPLHVALRGIDRSFSSAMSRDKKAPQSLSYCHPGVMESFQEYTSSQIGSSDEQKSGTAEGTFTKLDVQNFLKLIEQTMSGRSGDGFKRASRLIGDLIIEVNQQQPPNFEEVDRSLSAIAEIISNDLIRRMEQSELKSLRSEARKELKIYRKHLSKESYQKLSESYIQSHVRREHDLPSFSLFDLKTEIF